MRGTTAVDLLDYLRDMAGVGVFDGAAGQGDGVRPFDRPSVVKHV